MKRTHQSWSIIVFCYNEKAAIKDTVEKVKRVLPRIGDRSSEIVLVDDGSTDGSAEVIRELARKGRKIRAVFHPKNRGIGEALRSGYAAARRDNVCAVPADGQFNPQELLPYASVDNHTFVSFFREKQAGYSAFRKFLSGVNRMINGVFLGIHLRDVNWVKIYKRNDLSKLNLRLRSSLVESEICAKLLKRGNEVIEAPSVYHQRKSGKARGASLKIVLKALVETGKLAWAVWADGSRTFASGRD